MLATRTVNIGLLLVAALCAHPTGAVVFKDALGNTAKDTLGNVLGGSPAFPLPAGKYEFPTGFVLAAGEAIYLGAKEDDPAATFTFNVGTTLTTGASSAILLVNPPDGRPPHYIQWVVESNVVLGASSTFVGDLTSKSGAINTGAMVNLDGEVSASGAITLGAGPARAKGPLTSTTGAITLGAAMVVAGELTTAPGAGAITLGAGAQCGDAHAGGAFTSGAGTFTGTIRSNAAITLGAATMVTGFLTVDYAGAPITPTDKRALSAASAITKGAGAKCNQQEC
jgi:hypothetical protein